MTAKRGLLIGGAVLTLMLGFVPGIVPASAQSLDVTTRLQRIERDVRDLQAATFKKPPGTMPDADAPPPEPMASAPDLEPVLRRLDGLEESVSRLTGQMEELGHQLDMLSQKTDRLQKQMDVQAQAQAQAQVQAQLGNPPSDAPNAAPPNGPAVASLAPDNGPLLAPGPSNLGQIPANAALPKPQPPADPKREYDAAQGLLARAQYDSAQKAFRAFVDAHPDSELTPHALYRSGDIAYSIRKDYGSAAHDFAELLKKYPKAPDAPDSMLKLGLSLISLNQMKEGCAALAALPAKYPDAEPVIATRARNERRDNKCR